MRGRPNFAGAEINDRSHSDQVLGKEENIPHDKRNKPGEAGYCDSPRKVHKTEAG